MSIKNNKFYFFFLSLNKICQMTLLLLFLTLINAKKSKESNDAPGEEYGEDEIQSIGYISLKFKQNGNYLESPIKIGTPPQEMKLILDIGSKRTWISNQYFDRSKSSSFYTKEKHELHSQYDFKYGGLSSMETFEIENKTLEDFQFVLVDELINNNIQGVLSLGHEYDSKHQSLVYEMSHVSNTFYNMFTFKFGEEGNGELLIGDMTEEQKRKYNFINKCRFVQKGNENEQIKWRCELTQIFIGPVEDYPTFRENMMEQTGYIISRNDKNNIAIVEEVATFETIFNRIYVPKDVMAYLKKYYFIDFINEKNLCIFDELKDETKVRCTIDEVSKLKRLNFVFDGKTDLSFPSQNLFECDINGRCQFLVEFNKKYKNFIFGLPVFKMYNIIFDYNSRDLSFYSKDNKYLVKMAKNVGTKMLVVFFIFLAIALFMFLVGIGIVYLLRLKNRKREQLEEKIYEQF